jgi:HK97 family phage prohead protease
MTRSALAVQLAALALSVAPAALTRDAPAPGVDPQERRQPQVGGRGQRAAAFVPGSYNSDARTVDAVLSAGSPVRRYYFTEELEISAAAIDLGRVARGLCPLLDAHNQNSASFIGGTVTNVRIEGVELIGTFTFAETDLGRSLEGMVSRGELRGVSIGYRVTKWEITRTEEDGHETWRATAWELLEASLVPVPADPNAGVRSAPGSLPAPGVSATTEEEEDMRRNLPGGAVAPAVVAAIPPVDARAHPGGATIEIVARFTAGDAVSFIDQARSLNVETRGRELVDQNGRGEVGVEAARSALLQAAAEQQRAETGSTRSVGRISVSNANEDASRDAIAGALVARTLRSAPTDDQREYMGYRLLEIAASRAGLSPRERDPITILRAAHTTSDFPLLMENAGNRVLLARYGQAVPTYQALAARRDLTDFKPTAMLRIGDFPTLKPYQEDGEIKAGTIGEGKEKVLLGSYGRILRLSRQAIVNDDLGAFDQVFGSIGRMIARFENNTFYAMKASNNGLGPKLSDGKTLFHADHGNLADTGADITIDSLGDGRAKIRQAKDLDGNPLNLAPATLLVGPTQETKAEQLISPLQPQQAGSVNPFAGRLTPVVDASITGKAWELYANPDDLPTFVYGYLADAPGPRVISEETFNVDGMAWRVTEDFYCGAIDYRGAFRNGGPA